MSERLSMPKKSAAVFGLALGLAAMAGCSGDTKKDTFGLGVECPAATSVDVLEIHNDPGPTVLRLTCREDGKAENHSPLSVQLVEGDITGVIQDGDANQNLEVKTNAHGGGFLSPVSGEVEVSTNIDDKEQIAVVTFSGTYEITSAKVVEPGSK